jgi:hypothetical protein
MKAMNSVLSEENGQIKSVIAKHEELGIILRQAMAGNYDANTAVNTYNETLGKHYGRVNDVKSAWNGYVKNSKVYIDAMVKQMAALKLLDGVAGALAENERLRMTNSTLSNVNALDKQYRSVVRLAKGFKGGESALMRWMRSGDYALSTISELSEMRAFGPLTDQQEALFGLATAYNKLRGMDNAKEFVKNAYAISVNTAQINKNKEAAESLISQTGALSTELTESGSDTKEASSAYLELNGQVMHVLDAISYLNAEIVRLSAVTMDDVNAFMKAQGQMEEYRKKAQELTDLYREIMGFPQVELEVGLSITAPTVTLDDNLDMSGVLSRLKTQTEELDAIMATRNFKSRLRNEQWAKDLEEFNGELDGLLQKGFEGAVITISEGIGKMMAGEMNAQDFGNSILQFIGDFMQKMGEAFIALSSSMIAFNAALKTGQWYVALGIGVALVALGAAISSLANKGIGKQSSSGSSNSGGGGSSGNNIQSAQATEPIYYTMAEGGGLQLATANVQPQKIEIFGEFKQKGTDLVAVINQTNKKTGRIG